MQSAANTSLLEDEKKYRKLRKVLRQIENLNLLPRCLNEEEKTKVNLFIFVFLSFHRLRCPYNL
jgi:hypothetical protein